jgi:hypothetical protein
MPQRIAETVFPSPLIWLDQCAIQINAEIVSVLHLRRTNRCGKKHALSYVPKERLPNTIVFSAIKEWIDFLLSQLLRKGNVSCIVETSFAKDEDCILILQPHELYVLMSN